MGVNRFPFVLVCLFWETLKANKNIKPSFSLTVDCVTAQHLKYAFKTTWPSALSLIRPVMQRCVVRTLCPREPHPQMAAAHKGSGIIRIKNGRVTFKVETGVFV